MQPDMFQLKEKQKKNILKARKKTEQSVPHEAISKQNIKI